MIKTCKVCSKALACQENLTVFAEKENPENNISKIIIFNKSAFTGNGYSNIDDSPLPIAHSPLEVYLFQKKEKPGKGGKNR